MIHSVSKSFTTNRMNFEELKKHNNRESCWVLLHGIVFDLTDFVSIHPGGSRVILNLAGTDGTIEFAKFHPKDFVEKYLEPEMNLGPIDLDTVPLKEELSADEVQISLPPLSAVLNAFDFEKLAQYTLSPDGWAYYSSGGEDEITLRENHHAFNRIWLKPKVLVDVKKVNLSTKFFNYETALPFYITATALGKLGHKDGEVVLTKAAGKKGIIQMMPTLASW